MKIHRAQVVGTFTTVTGSTISATGSFRGSFDGDGKLATTGSNTFSGNQTVNGSLTVTGNLTAQQFIVSSSVTHLTTSFSSGSTKFGDTIDDTHQFTGSLVVSGSLTVNGTNTILGSGTANYVPKFTSTSVVGNGSLVNDSSGNLGIGVTPSAWGNAFKAIDINTTGTIASSGNDVQILSNVFNNGTSFIYKQTQGAGRFRINEGQFIWQNAPSGTAGNAITFTQAMTLDANGRLFIGATSGVGNDRVLIVTDSSGTYTQALNLKDSNASANGTNFIVIRKSDDTYLGTIGRSGTDNAMAVNGNAYLSLQTELTERMRITSTGNVGIGTSSPTNKLEVFGGSSDGNILASTNGFYSYVSVQKSNAVSTIGRWNTMYRGDTYFGNAINSLIFLGERFNSSGVVDGFYVPLMLQTNGNVVMCAGSNVLGNGNVGIGTTSPGLNLSVQGLYGMPTTSGTQTGGIFRVQDSSSNISLDMGVIQYFGSWIQSINKSNSSNLTLALNPNGGNVGIGTSSPSELLVAYGLSTSRPRLVVGQLTTSTPLYSTYNSQDTPAIEVNTSTTTGFAGFTMSNSNNTNGNTLGAISFAAAGTSNGEKRGAIIGSSLESASTSSVTANLIFYTTSASSVAERMRITSGGTVFVGTTSLVAPGTFNAYSNISSPAGRIVGGPSMADGNIALMVDKYSTTNTTSQWFLGFTTNNQSVASGVITANGASQAAFGSWSDRRLKENIVDLPNQLSNILALRPVEFDYIESEGGGHQTSFIAQEFEEIYPDAVGERPDGMKTLTGWGKTEAILVKAIQEQQAQINELKSLLNV
jgi:hypothetical protein